MTTTTTTTAAAAVVVVVVVVVVERRVSHFVFLRESRFYGWRVLTKV